VDAGGGGTAAELPPSTGPVLFAANDAELTQRLSQSQPGQHIVLTGSLYQQARTLGDGDMVINRDLQHMPVIKGRFALIGADSWVYGLDFDGASVSIAGDRARIVRCKVHDLGSTSPIAVGGGRDVVVAYCEVYRWGTTAPCGGARGINIRSPKLDGSDGATRIEVFRNYIHDQIGRNPETCANDAEVIAAGQTGATGRGESHFEGHFHHNLIVNCLADNEGFGVKSSYNLIEYNHLIEVRGFNLRLGGFNRFIGNRVEGSLHPGGDRGGYRNLTLGEVFAGALTIRGGDYDWLEGGAYRYMRSDGTKVIGAHAQAIKVGVDAWDVWTRPARDTLVESTNVAPVLGPEQIGTIDRWDQAPSMPVPQAITLTPADVGPFTSQ
jgi:hypothetical protein